MTPEYANGNVRAACPDCDGAVTTFEMRVGGSEMKNVGVEVDGHLFDRTVYSLLRCAGCGRAGLATVAADHSVADGRLIEFYPMPRDVAQLPLRVPPPV